MNNKYFDFNRLMMFLKREMVLTGNSLLIAAGAILATLLVVTILVAYFNPYELHELKALYLVVFFLGGFILTSKAFSEMHSPQTGYAYLTLPVSTTERLVGAWLVTSPMYILLFTVFSTVIMLIGVAIAGPESFSVQEYFDNDYWGALGGYMVLQTIFFLGASYFRKNNFLKTLLALFLLFIFVMTYIGINVWVIFGPNFEGNYNGNVNFQDEEVYSLIGKALFWFVLGPLMLVVSYFRLKERQI